MDCYCGVHVSYSKDDIIQDCKYCSKTTKKGFGEFHAFGYECRLKSEKRNANRCRSCYFGRRRY
ncbi:MAG: hypothetical protein IJ551_09730 [Prevotella sp.]|nr:hypothetical protein [Prevotella sp.]